MDHLMDSHSGHSMSNQHGYPCQPEADAMEILPSAPGGESINAPALNPNMSAAASHGLYIPALTNPELSKPFDANEHQIADFNFTPIKAVYSQHWTQRIKPRNKRAHKKRSDTKKEAAPAVSAAAPVAPAVMFHNTTELSPLSTFKTAASLVPVRRSPRKRVMRGPTAPEKDQDIKFATGWNDSEIDLWNAKASIRNHLMKMSPVKSAATKRRVNGHERNWIRAHKMDADVKYLLQYPGELSAEKVRDLIEKRDLLSLEPVEEADGSLIMPTETLPEASHTSEASRQEKLDVAATMVQQRLASVAEEMPSIEEDEVVIEEATEPKIEEAAEPEIEKAAELEIASTPSSVTAVDEHREESVAKEMPSIEEDDEDVIEEAAAPEITSTPSSVTTIDEAREESVVATPENTEKQEDIQLSSSTKRRYIDESLGSPRKRRCSAPSPQTPKTPQAITASQEIVDVDLHEQPDIFASVMPKRHQEVTPAMPAQPSFIGAATPQPTLSSPVGSLIFDAETSAQWSPLASTPAQAYIFTAGATPTTRSDVGGEVTETPSQQVIEAPGPEVAETPSQQAIEAPGPEVVETPSNQVIEPAAETESPAEAPAQDDDRTFLRLFMNKHNAVKSKAGAASPGPRATASSPAPRTADGAPIRIWADPSQTAGEAKPNGLETPLRASPSKRAVLAQLDTNSPSPVKARVGKRKLEDEPEEDKPNNKGKDDEKEATPEPSPKRRRGLRARKPVAPSTPIPANARAVRSGEKDLAALTRANTRANKGNSIMPEEVLERFAADPMGQKWKERKEVVDAKAARATHPKTRAGKSVRWAQTLAQFREGSAAPEDDEDKNKQPEAAVKEQEEPPKKKAKATKAKQAASSSIAAPVVPKTPPKSKLPAPVSQARRAAPAALGPATSKVGATANKVVKKPIKEAASKIGQPRPTRAAAQKSNLNMGLTATGTPIRRGRGRAKAAK